MTKYILTVALLLVLAAMPLGADALLAEVGDVGTAVAQGVELSLLGGTIGWGAGAFWPLHEIEQLGGVAVGPFVAVGNQLIAAGVGAQLGVEIPMLENYIDFVAAGGAYKHDALTFEVWIGKVWK